MYSDDEKFRYKMDVIMQLVKELLASPTIQRLAVPVQSAQDPYQWLMLDEGHFDERSAEANKVKKGRYRSIRLVGESIIEHESHIFLFIAMLVEPEGSFADSVDWIWQRSFIDIVNEKMVRGFRINEISPRTISLPFNNFDAVATSVDKIQTIGLHPSGLMPDRLLMEAHIFVQEILGLCNK